MMKKIYFIVFLIAITHQAFAQASFQFVDSLCKNVSIPITNNSVNDLTDCFSFDSLNIQNNLTATSLSNYNSLMNYPLGGRLVEDGGNYYLFSTQQLTNNLVRWDFGTNPLSTTPTNAVVISNILPGNYNEDIEFIKQGTNWYAVVNGGSPSSASLGLLSFGTSITNTPTYTAYTVSGLGNWIHQMNIFKQGNNYIGFTVCRSNGEIQRLDFGTSITNNPTITTLTITGNPITNFAMENENGIWYMLVMTNILAPSSFTLLNFGTNISNNTPTVASFSNPSSLINGPRSVKLFKTCHQLFGVVNNQSNHAGLLGDVVTMKFNNNSINGSVTAATIGASGLGWDLFWNQTSNTFWANNAYHFFAFDGLDSTIIRIDIPVNGNTIPISLQQNPSISFSQSGIHQVQLLTNFGNANQSYYCNDYFTIPDKSSHQTLTLCSGDTATLQLNVAAQNISWSPFNHLSCSSCIAPKAYPASNTLYIATDSVHHCFSTDSFAISVAQPSAAHDSATICSNQTYLFNGQQLSIAGVYKDTLTNYHGCDSITTLQLTVNPIIQQTIHQTICSNQTYLFHGQQLSTAGIYKDTIPSSLCYAIITLQLTVNPITQQTITKTICSNQTYTLPSGQTVNHAGLYADTFQNHLGCDSIITTQLAVANLVSVHLGNDTTICAGNTIVLNATNTTATYLWNDGSIQAVKTVTQSGLYTVLVKNPPCPSAFDSIRIMVDACPPCQLAIPNAFSPNNDGNNDVFKVLTECDWTDFYLAIYNRWGQKVFYTENIKQGWDGYFNGIAQPISVFAYYVRATNTANETKFYKGDVTLIR